MLNEVQQAVLCPKYQIRLAILIEVASLISFSGQRTACCTSSSMTIAFLILTTNCRLAHQMLLATRDFRASYMRSLYLRRQTFLSVMPQLSARRRGELSPPGLVAREKKILMLVSGQATTMVEVGRHHKSRPMEFSMRGCSILVGTRCSINHQATGRRCSSSRSGLTLPAGGVN